MRWAALILLLSCSSDKPVQCPPCVKCVILPKVILLTLKPGETLDTVLLTDHSVVYQPETKGGNLDGKKVRVKITIDED